MPNINVSEQNERTVANARSLYEAYTDNSDGKNFQGGDCPPWDQLPEAIKSHWCAVAQRADGLASNDAGHRFRELPTTL